MFDLRIWVYATPADLPADPPRVGAAVAIDVLRATSTIAQALWAGARAVMPYLEPEEARRAAAAATATGSSGKPDSSGSAGLPGSPGAGPHLPPLLAGERGGVQIPGFDLGNSPREMTPERVRGREIYVTTTNGTRAILRAAALGPVYLAALVNRAAVVDRLAALGADVAVVCAGGQGAFSLEDVVGAGALVDGLAARGIGVPGNDLALAAVALFRHWEGRLAELFRQTDHGRRLLELGLAADLDWCARLDVLPVAPCYREGRITAA